MNPHFEILLVEDNPGDAMLTTEAFRERGFRYKVTTVQDGQEAIRYLRKLPPYERAARPDVMLLDLNLPRKDGRELLAEIKQDPDLKFIPVIVLTTSDATQDVQKAYDLHANCYMTKPLQMEQFLRKITSLENFWLQVVRLPNR